MNSFEKFGLKPGLLQAIEKMGFETPSPIQEQTIPVLLEKAQDFIGLAATGTGKTAAFALPLLQNIDPTIKQTQALILCPTRELVVQVCEQINLLGREERIFALPVYGGVSYIPQIHGLKKGASIVVGTPGRIVDHLEKGNLNLSALKTLILDEADEMISMGFKESLQTVLESVNRKSASFWLFSATMNKEIKRIADRYLENPARVQINKTEVLSNTVEQFYFFTRESDKPEILSRIIEANDDFYGIIFCQTKVLVSQLNQLLVERGYKVDCLHGDKDQKSREVTMKAFRTRKVNILVCTDVASRGLDVKNVTHVINYSLPRELDSYVHRIGRTARSGSDGIAISLVAPNHRYLISRIEKMTNSKMKEGKLPTRDDLIQNKISKVLNEFLSQDQADVELIYPLLGSDWEEAVAEMDAAEMISRFMGILAKDVLMAEDVAPLKMKVYDDDSGSRSGGGGRRRAGNRGNYGRGNYGGGAGGGSRSRRSGGGRQSQSAGGRGRSRKNPRSN